MLPANLAPLEPLAVGPGRAALEQPPLGKEELLVRPEREPIRHPGDVVGHMRGCVARRTEVFGWDRLRVSKVVREEGPDQPPRLFLLRPAVLPEVDPLEEEGPQDVERLSKPTTEVIAPAAV